MNEENLSEQFKALTTTDFGLGVSNGAMYWKPTEQEAAQGHKGWAIPVNFPEITHSEKMPPTTDSEGREVVYLSTGKDNHKYKFTGTVSGQHLDEGGDAWRIGVRHGSSPRTINVPNSSPGMRDYPDSLRVTLNSNSRSPLDPESYFGMEVSHPSEIPDAIRTLMGHIKSEYPKDKDLSVAFGRAVHIMHSANRELSRRRAQAYGGVDPFSAVRSTVTGPSRDPFNFRDDEESTTYDVDSKTGNVIKLDRELFGSGYRDAGNTNQKLFDLADVHNMDVEDMRKEIMDRLSGAPSWLEGKQFKEMMKAEESRESGKYNPWGK